MTRPRLRSVWVVTALLLGACMPPSAPPPAPQLPILEAGTSESFQVTLTPGTWYTVNFVQFVSPGESAETTAEFSTNDAIEIMPIAFAHPRAEIGERPDEGGHVLVHVDCPGLGNHPLRITAGNAAPSGSLVAWTNEMGHYGFAFRSKSPRTTALGVTVRSVTSRIALMYVGFVSGDAIRLDPSAPIEPNPLRSAALR